MPVPLWVAVAVLYVVEQTWSARRGGWRAVCSSAAVLPELCYSQFLNVVYVVSLVGFIAGSNERWGRTEATTVAGTIESNRHRLGQHIVKRLLAAAGVLVGIGVATLPFVDLHLAWTLVSIFVLVGSANTLFRLLPLSQR